jgi:tetrapyrrole methylase family protein/MazG family protein
MAGRIVAVGLGPAGPDLLTAGTLATIERIPRRWLRTTRHPAAVALAGAPSFDDVYDRADTFDDVYRRIADTLLAEADEHGEVLYAVPGSPRVLERTVDLLAEAAADGRIELEVLPGLSFVDLAWVRLGIDPLEDGVRLVDAHRFAEKAAGERGPLLVAHCHNRRVLSDVKLAVDEPPRTPVTVLQRLGLPDEAVTEVAWADLDRSVEPDHLTSLWIPELAAPVATELVAFSELVARLRAECPWDRQQTHMTLTRHLLEESYEVLEAIEAWAAAEAAESAYGDGGDDVGAHAVAEVLAEASGEADEHLAEELGDLLFQVVFHATLGAERGAFTLADVARGIHDKLVLRHPHVFGSVEADDTDAVVRNWEQIKKAEKGRDSVMDGIPANLPSLLYAHKVQRKAGSIGATAEQTDPDLAGAVERLLAADRGDGPGPDEVGAALYAVVATARRHEVDAEAALRATAARIRDQVRATELDPG